VVATIGIAAAEVARLSPGRRLQMNRRQRDLDTAQGGKLSSPSDRPSPVPDESFVRPPAVKPSPTDHVFGAEQMVHFYDAPGEYGWIAEGKDHGLAEMSVIITDTRPGGGPPLHCHDTDEAQVLAEGHYRVLIGDRCFDVTGPATVRIPAGVAHTFVNPGDRPVHIVGVLPGDTISYRELGPNPLLQGAGRGRAASLPNVRSGRTRTV
jgi:mannose-6-phosphate isomerase-like protein (cupin superfamily)